MSEAFSPVRRSHAADEVFERLAAAIVRGELAAGAALPAERLLVERFGVSRVIVRQAVHRLAALGLVRVKQGGATLVLDPAEATDLGVLALYYRFAPSGAKGAIEAADMIEKQYLQGLSILEVASRRASVAELTGLLAWVDAEAPRVADVAAFEEHFWRALAAAGKNRIFAMEVGWWYRALRDRPLHPRVAAAPAPLRVAFYRELLRRLLDRADAVGHYLATIRPLLDELLGPPPSPAAEPPARKGSRPKTSSPRPSRRAQRRPAGRPC